MENINKNVTAEQKENIVAPNTFSGARTEGKTHAVSHLSCLRYVTDTALLILLVLLVTNDISSRMPGPADFALLAILPGLSGCYAFLASLNGRTHEVYLSFFTGACFFGVTLLYSSRLLGIPFNVLFAMSWYYVLFCFVFLLISFPLAKRDEVSRMFSRALFNSSTILAVVSMFCGAITLLYIEGYQTLFSSSLLLSFFSFIFFLTASMHPETFIDSLFWKISFIVFILTLVYYHCSVHAG